MMKTILTFMLFLCLTACSGLQGVENSSLREIDNHKGPLKKIAQGKNVRVFETSYLGAKVVLKETNNYPASFKKEVAIRTSGTLVDLVEQVRNIAGVNFQVEQDQISVGGVPAGTGGTGGSGGMIVSEAEARHSIHYSGDIAGYFHMLANKFGAEWTYNEGKRLVQFALRCTKTFAVFAMPGDMSYKSTISNNSSSSGSSDGTTDSNSESSQTNQTQYTGDFWKTLTDSVTTMLTATGKSHCNPNIGTVTVTDTPKAVRGVEQYINQLNKRLGRQIAYEVRVLALQTKDSGDVGFDLNAVIQGSTVGVTSVPAKAYQTLEGAGSLTAQLLTGDANGSSLIVSALKSWGDVSQITSASGFAMHNTPTPVQVGAETGYVSSAATTLDGSGNSTATIETSTVPEGFYMTVVPNILEDNNVLLQYNVSLSNIEQIVTFEASDDTKVQLPEVTSRSFSQKVRMQMGQTLVLGGFEQTVLAESNGYGILSGGSSNEELKRIIIIIISIDSAGE